MAKISLDMPEELLHDLRIHVGDEKKFVSLADAIRSACRKMLDQLDSIDMSLDLIYGSFSGYEGPIAGIRGKQRFLGRTLSAPGAAADEN